MASLTMLEYRSDTRTGSKPVSATGKEMRRSLAGSAAAADAAISSATNPLANRRNLDTHAPRMKKRRNVPFSAANSPTSHCRDKTAPAADRCLPAKEAGVARSPARRQRRTDPPLDDQAALLGRCDPGACRARSRARQADR